MKKILIYIGLIAAGLLLGFWLFNGPQERTADTHKDHQVASDQRMWTCSMHPQIMQPEPGQCPICGMDLIPAETGGEGMSPDQIRLSENAMALANIRTMSIGGNGKEGSELLLSGELVVNEKNLAVQVTHFAGRIEELHVDFEGEEVRRGDLLATIYSPELVAAQQELLTAAGLKEKQPSLYQAVRNKLELWKLSDRQITAIESSGKLLENFPVYATVSGTVTNRLVQEGDYVKEGQALLELVDLSTLWAEFDSYENQIRNVALGQEIKISTNAYPDTAFSAKVSFIDPVLNSARRTVTVRAELENGKGLLKPGMFVQGVLQREGMSISEGGLTVPKSAVLWTGERSLVYVKPDPSEPVFEMREVRIGNVFGNSYEVLDGLSPGEEIVVNGTFTVDAAAQLRGKRSMMNAKSGLTTSSEMKSIPLSSEFQQQFLHVLDQYLQLKEALVASDVNKVSFLAGEMLEAMEQLPSPGTDEKVVERIQEIKQLLEGMVRETDLEEQRQFFIGISKNTILFAKNVKNLEHPLYVQHCPMADADAGADWLSRSQQVENPYFGASMLTCGEVKDTIK